MQAMSDLPGLFPPDLLTGRELLPIQGVIGGTRSPRARGGILEGLASQQAAAPREGATVPVVWDVLTSAAQTTRIYPVIVKTSSTANVRQGAVGPTRHLSTP